MIHRLGSLRSALMASGASTARTSMAATFFDPSFEGPPPVSVWLKKDKWESERSGRRRRRAAIR